MQSHSFFYPFAFDIFLKTTKSITEILESVPKNKKILLWSVEWVEETKLLKYINLVRSLGLESNTHWWLQPSHQYSFDIQSLLGNKLHLIDLDLLLLDFHVNTCCTSVPNKKWNSKTARFLFPTGKPNKPNRIRLLYKFNQHNLLNNCDWSLFVNNEEYIRSRQLLKELSDDEYDIFVKQHLRKIDNFRIINLGTSSDYASGYPFDGNAYFNTSFRVISETQMCNQPFITEKTWITMINRQPFILAGYLEHLQYLKKFGYRTFDNYLPIPHYDSIINQEQRLDAVVENTKFWIDNIHKQEKEILNDIEHNYQLLLDNIAKTTNQVKKLAMDLEISDYPPYKIIPLSTGQWAWTLFYYNVKDPNWPDCLDESCFDQLPNHVQADCINLFGYKRH